MQYNMGGGKDGRWGKKLRFKGKKGLKNASFRVISSKILRRESYDHPCRNLIRRGKNTSKMGVGGMIEMHNINPNIFSKGIC